MTTASAAAVENTNTNHDRRERSSVGADEGNTIGDEHSPSRTKDDTETLPGDREHLPENEETFVRSSSSLSAHDERKDEDQPPSSTMLVQLCSALLLCPACSPPVRLVNPTTLHCGHTVCSRHVKTAPTQDSSSSTPVPPSVTPSPSPEPSPRNERASFLSPSSRRRNPILDSPPAVPVVPSCPLPTCKPGIRRPVVTPNIPRESSVAYYPPIPQTVIEHPNVTVPEPLLDVSICRILHLIERTENQEHGFKSAEEGNRSESSGSEDEESDEASDDGSQGTSTPVIPSESGQRRRVLRINKRRKRVRSLQYSEGAHHRHTIRKELEEQFKKELVEYLTCEICFVLLYEPVTTPCQHTFCAKCLQRSLDHNPKCPLCRQSMPPFSYFQDHPLNKVLLSLLLKACPDAYTERKQVLEEEERSGRCKVPIFVAQLSFPGIPTLLHIYEPRYRLLLRRCLESTDACFGMIMPPRTGGSTSSEYGTMLKIKSVQMLPDGRSMVETIGLHRFRLMETGTLDGYMVGRIERVDDISEDLEEEAEKAIASLSSNENDNTQESTSSASPSSSTQQRSPSPPTTEELMAVCHAFVDQLRNGTAPWVVQRLNNTFGPMPSDVSSFSFWMAQVLPIDEHEKAKLLIIRSAKCRLRLVVHWIEQLNSNWWFSSGCSIN